MTQEREIDRESLWNVVVMKMNILILNHDDDDEGGAAIDDDNSGVV